uniref:Claudin 11a n=1 Tax=Neogobius melanostomus TaxID=47308 RepID=A0A8C6TQP6_9GOBI
MSNSCIQLGGFLLSVFGWLSIVIATATNDWVLYCKYGLNTCKKMDELSYHCVSLTQLLDLPAYIQTTRALMITGSILGLPAVAMLLMSMPCINLGNEPQSSKNQRTVIGGVVTLVMGACGLVSTVWFPIGAYHEQGLMSFGFSLYTGWIGTIFSLLSGCMLACCISESHSRSYQDNNRFYYSNRAVTTARGSSSLHQGPLC